MAGAFADRTSATTGFRLKALECWSFTDNSFFDHEIGQVEIVVVLGICNRTAKSFENEGGGLFRSEPEKIQRIGGGHTLNGARDLTSLEGRDLSKPMN